MGKWRMGKHKRPRGSQTGLATVEFALTILFVMIVIFWAFELMMFMYSYTVLADAAKEGVRYAVVHGCGTAPGSCSGVCAPACTDASGGNVVTQVKNFAALSFHDTSGIVVDTANMYPDGSAACPSRVQITVHYVYKPFFSLGWNPPTIYATAQGRIAN